MQIVPGVIPISQIMNNTVMQTMLSGKTIKFYLTSTGMLFTLLDLIYILD
jgi:hypothetical protein